MDNPKLTRAKIIRAELREMKVEEDEDVVEVKDDEEETEDEETEGQRVAADGEAGGFDGVKRLRRGPAGPPLFEKLDFSELLRGDPTGLDRGPEIFPPFLPTK